MLMKMLAGALRAEAGVGGAVEVPAGDVVAPAGRAKGRGSYQSQSYQAAVGGGFGFNTYSGGTGGWGERMHMLRRTEEAGAVGDQQGATQVAVGGEEIHLHLAVIIVLWVMEGSTGPLVREDKKNKKK